jgi:ketosteroid isomerase-like protein
MKSNLLVRKSESRKEATGDVWEKSTLSHTDVLEKRLCEGVAKQGMMRTIISRLAIAIVAGLLIAPLVMFRATGKAKPAVGPTEESALAADQELARAMQTNDTVGIYRMLDKDWAVIPSNGGVYEGPSVFPSGIKSGFRTLKKMTLSEPRVRLYGNTAVVTTKVELSGMLQGKPFEVTERQTDVWFWKDGGWKCVLTHETKIPK